MDTKHRPTVARGLGRALAVGAVLAAVAAGPAGVASAASIGGLTAGGATATSLQRSGDPIHNPVVGASGTGVPLDAFPAGGKGSGTEATCALWSRTLNEDQGQLDAATDANDLGWYQTSKELFDEDYNDALSAGCAVID
jgi:hypothetical protein